MEVSSPNQSFKSPFEDTSLILPSSFPLPFLLDDSINLYSPQNSPNHASQPNYLQQEDTIDEDADVAFDYDLLLPPPNPLPQKKPTQRDPIKVIYEYLVW